jgi:hypothetical protein
MSNGDQRQDGLPDLPAQFRAAGNLALLWQWEARNLLLAGNVLDQREAKRGHPARGEALWSLRGPALLMYGLAVENLLKAVLVAAGLDATPSGALNRRIKHHRLAELWQEARLPIHPGFADALEVLRWAVESGKYPVGTKPADDPDPLDRMRTDAKLVATMMQVAEDALRALPKNQAFERIDLYQLGRND